MDEALLPSTSPIQGVIIPGNDKVVVFAKKLQAAGFDVKPIRSPTVPAGTERVRICIHAHNTTEEVDSLTSCILKFMREAEIEGKSHHQHLINTLSAKL